jgi:4-alpha-glucanotransferase
MVVLHWAFGGGAGNPHAPRNHRPNQVVYTSTHDTDTTVGWWNAMSKRDRARTGLDPDQPHWTLIEIAMQSRASLAIVPAQDVLGLGSDARMNRPGEADGNWSWRLERGQLTDELAQRLRAATELGVRA